MKLLKKNSMDKLAVFVEGKTEALFLKHLIEHVAIEHNFAIESNSIKGGIDPERFLIIQNLINLSNEQFYIEILDCGNDVQVGKKIKRSHKNLFELQYSKIIGLRDVRPIAREGISKLRQGLMSQFEASPIKIKFILAIMEIEAWFLSEYQHFTVIDPMLTPELIASSLKFNPQDFNFSQTETPAEVLNACYLLAGKTYSKTKVQWTIDALDFKFIYHSLRRRIPDLSNLIGEIESFLKLPIPTLDEICLPNMVKRA
jgi:hypothetical protein